MSFHVKQQLDTMMEQEWFTTSEIMLLTGLSRHKVVKRIKETPRKINETPNYLKQPIFLVYKEFLYRIFMEEIIKNRQIIT